MFRIAAVTVALIALMLAVKDGRVLTRSHVVGSCAKVADVADGTNWHRCVRGRLTGAPGLTSAGCWDWGKYQDAELWHCPAELTPNTVRQ